MKITQNNGIFFAELTAEQSTVSYLTTRFLSTKVNKAQKQTQVFLKQTKYGYLYQMRRWYVNFQV